MLLPPAEVLEARLTRLRSLLAAESIDALAVTSLANIAYLTGFHASAAALVVGPERLTLIGDGRYSTGLADRERACPFIAAIELPSGASYDQAVVDVLTSLTGLRVGFESSQLTVRRYRYLLSALGRPTWEDTLIETDGLVEKLRVVKDAWEAGRLREGAGRLSEVAKCILPNVLAGRTEADLAAEIDAALRHAGFERTAFDTIVASGPHAALPHARPGARRLEPGDLVVLDFGGVLDGYCTDLTRTVTAGPAGDRERAMIAHVVEAQAAAFAAVRPGGRPEAVDAAARDVLGRHGLAEAFTHGTGHGLGLEVHEAPRITRARADHAEPPLGAGMVMTLEPGAYVPGWGGVRIEDDVLVTAEGGEWLTDVPREVD